MKIANGVPPEIIEKHGTVSQETANAMAQAVRQAMGAAFGIGITGVAGPGEVEGQPAGLAFLAIADANDVRGFELRVPPRRVVIKRRLSNQALIELRKLITASAPATL